MNEFKGKKILFLNSLQPQTDWIVFVIPIKIDDIMQILKNSFNKIHDAFESPRTQNNLHILLSHFSWMLFPTLQI